MESLCPSSSSFTKWHPIISKMCSKCGPRLFACLLCPLLMALQRKYLHLTCLAQRPGFWSRLRKGHQQRELTEKSRKKEMQMGDQGGPGDKLCLTHNECPSPKMPESALQFGIRRWYSGKLCLMKEKEMSVYHGLNLNCPYKLMFSMLFLSCWNYFRGPWKL